MDTTRHVHPKMESPPPDLPPSLPPSLPLLVIRQPALDIIALDRPVPRPLAERLSEKPPGLTIISLGAGLEVLVPRCGRLAFVQPENGIGRIPRVGDRQDFLSKARPVRNRIKTRLSSWITNESGVKLTCSSSCCMILNASSRSIYSPPFPRPFLAEDQ